MGISRSFTLMIVLMEVLGLTAVTLMAVLTSKYFGGYAWDGSAKQFNLHPILMVTGFLFFYGNSVLLYKLGAGTSITKFKLKVAHGFLHLLAFILAVIALMAVFKYHRANGYSNAHSLHSWMGLGTVSFYGLQILLSFLVFLYPRAKEEFRAAFKTLHVFFGLFLLGMITICCLTGLTEKILYTPKQFNELSPVVILTNLFAIAVVSFAGVVAYTVTNPKYAALHADRYDQME